MIGVNKGSSSGFSREIILVKYGKKVSVSENTIVSKKLLKRCPNWMLSSTFYPEKEVESDSADALCPGGGERATRSGARPPWPNVQRLYFNIR